MLIINNRTTFRPGTLEILIQRPKKRKTKTPRYRGDLEKNTQRSSAPRLFRSQYSLTRASRANYCSYRMFKFNNSKLASILILKNKNFNRK